jgi:hypothetical protein
MNKPQITFKEIAEKAGKFTMRCKLKGFYPDFIISDIAFFEIKPYWGIHKVVEVQETFKNPPAVGFIYSKDFIKEHEMTCLDWVVGGGGKLFLIIGSKYVEVIRSPKDYERRDFDRWQFVKSDWLINLDDLPF